MTGTADPIEPAALLRALADQIRTRQQAAGRGNNPGDEFVNAAGAAMYAWHDRGDPESVVVTQTIAHGPGDSRATEITYFHRWEVTAGSVVAKFVRMFRPNNATEELPRGSADGVVPAHSLADLVRQHLTPAEGPPRVVTVTCDDAADVAGWTAAAALAGLPDVGGIDEGVAPGVQLHRYLDREARRWGCPIPDPYFDSRAYGHNVFARHAEAVIWGTPLADETGFRGFRSEYLGRGGLHVEVLADDTTGAVTMRVMVAHEEVRARRGAGTKRYEHVITAAPDGTFSATAEESTTQSGTYLSRKRWVLPFDAEAVLAMIRFGELSPVDRLGYLDKRPRRVEGRGGVPGWDAMTRISAPLPARPAAVRPGHGEGVTGGR